MRRNEERERQVRHADKKDEKKQRTTRQDNVTHTRDTEQGCDAHRKSVREKR